MIILDLSPDQYHCRVLAMIWKMGNSKPFALEPTQRKIINWKNYRQKKLTYKDGN